MRIDLKIPGGGEFHFENEPMSEERLFGVGVLIVIALFLHLFLEINFQFARLIPQLFLKI